VPAGLAALARPGRGSGAFVGDDAVHHVVHHAVAAAFHSALRAGTSLWFRLVCGICFGAWREMESVVSRAARRALWRDATFRFLGLNLNATRARRARVQLHRFIIPTIAAKAALDVLEVLKSEDIKPRAPFLGLSERSSD